MPRVWAGTIDEHRTAVRAAILDATSKLVAERGLVAVSMSDIATEAGIGRATLYKYFSSLEAVLAAWHERLVTSHVEELRVVASGDGPAIQRLTQVLAVYAHTRRAAGAGADALHAALHGGEHMEAAHLQLDVLVAELLTEAAAAGDVRSDVAPRELATFCIHALGAASTARSSAAIGRLLDVIDTAIGPVSH